MVRQFSARMRKMVCVAVPLFARFAPRLTFNWFALFLGAGVLGKVGGAQGTATGNDSNAMATVRLRIWLCRYWWQIPSPPKLPPRRVTGGARTAPKPPSSTSALRDPLRMRERMEGEGGRGGYGRMGGWLVVFAPRASFETNQQGSAQKQKRRERDHCMAPPRKIKPQSRAIRPPQK